LDRNRLWRNTVRQRRSSARVTLVFVGAAALANAGRKNAAARVRYFDRALTTTPTRGPRGQSIGSGANDDFALSPGRAERDRLDHSEARDGHVLKRYEVAHGVALIPIRPS